MALADPQSVSISGTSTGLARTGLSLEEGRFADSTGQVVFTVRHSSSRRTRHTVKLQKAVVVPDPLVPNTNQNVSYSCHLVMDHPRNGVDLASVVALANALVAWATAGNLTKVAGGES